MARLSFCDCCGKQLSEDNPIAAKLYLSPWNGSGHSRHGAHNTYSSHLDVGKCCVVKVNQLGKWQQRKKGARRPGPSKKKELQKNG